MAGVNLTAIFGGEGFDALKNVGTENKLLIAALEYAKKGLLVFPCHDIDSGDCSCGKQNCESAGKHPRINGWIDQATSEENMIRTWWDLWPNANIGIATGPGSGVWVLDVDKKDGGLESLDKIVKENGTLGITPTQKSGGGGLHYFFTYDRRVASKVKAIEGIDTRSDGGLIIVSPSANKTGAYEWINDFTTPIATAPEWLINMVKREEHKPQVNTQQMTFEPLAGDEIESALSFIDAFDRDTWLHVGMGLKAHGLGQHVWDRWASGCAEKYSQKSQDRTWRSFKKNDIKIGTVIDLAKKAGYIPAPPPEEDYSHIDISGILSTLGGKKEEDRKPSADKEKNKSVFARAPGIIGEIARFHEDTAPKSQPELAVASALSLVSMLCSRKFITSEGNLTSVYVLGVAKSASGKEHGAKVIESVLEATGKNRLNGGSWFTSDSACYQALIEQPRQIVVSDELGITVTAGNADKSGMQLKLRSFLMQAITKLDSIVPPLRYSQRGLSDEQKKSDEAVLKCPALTLYGTTTSGTFFEALDMAQVHDGFLGRLLVVESTQEREKMRRQRKSANNVPSSIKHWVGEIEAKGGNLATVETGEQRPSMTVVDFTNESYALLDQYEDKILDLQDSLEAEKLDILVGRALEYSMRVALAAQLAINPSSTAISKEATEWAIEFVHHCYQTTLTRVREDVRSSKHEKRMNDLLHAIKAIDTAGGEITMTALSKKTRSYTSSERSQIVQALVDTGEIYIETQASAAGRPKQVIKLKNIT